jgi:hypothetical protein
MVMLILILRLVLMLKLKLMLKLGDEIGGLDRKKVKEREEPRG